MNAGETVVGQGAVDPPAPRFGDLDRVSAMNESLVELAGSGQAKRQIGSDGDGRQLIPLNADHAVLRPCRECLEGRSQASDSLTVVAERKVRAAEADAGPDLRTQGPEGVGQSQCPLACLDGFDVAPLVGVEIDQVPEDLRELPFVAESLGEAQSLPILGRCPVELAGGVKGSA